MSNILRCTSFVCNRIVMKLISEEITITNKTLIDLTDFRDVWLKEVKVEVKDIELDLFKLMVESIIIASVTNNGFIDDSLNGIFGDELYKLGYETMNLGVDPFDLPMYHGELIISIHSYIMNITNSLHTPRVFPVGWDDINGKSTLVVGEFENMKRIIMLAL